MFEFEDNDFTLMESFSLSANQDDLDLPVGTYLGDGVWVVDPQDVPEEVEQAHFRLSES